jgi:hypothetical protein
LIGQREQEMFDADVFVAEELRFTRGAVKGSLACTGKSSLLLAR